MMEQEKRRDGSKQILTKLEEEAKQNPDSPEAWYNLALQHETIGDWSNAEICYINSINRKNLLLALIRYGVLCLKLNNKERADVLLNRAYQLNTEYQDTDEYRSAIALHFNQ